MLHYSIQAGTWGEVVIWHGSTVIARKLKNTVLRTEAPIWESGLAGRMGCAWLWLGIESDNLPAGVSTRDVVNAYRIARDEMLDAGLTVA
jgi:hypothetical protein